MIPNKALAAIVAWIPRWPMPNSQLHTPTPRPSTFATMLQETPSSSVVDTILHTGRLHHNKTQKRLHNTTAPTAPRHGRSTRHNGDSAHSDPYPVRATTRAPQHLPSMAPHEANSHLAGKGTNTSAPLHHSSTRSKSRSSPSQQGEPPQPRTAGAAATSRHCTASRHAESPRTSSRPRREEPPRCPPPHPPSPPAPHCRTGAQPQASQIWPAHDPGPKRPPTRPPPPRRLATLASPPRPRGPRAATAASQIRAEKLAAPPETEHECSSRR